tara:strand:+ start:550 stop:1284 length:735 start_codon:yes stop_codon:yes gene_type:complete
MALPATASLPQNGSIVSRWLLDEANGTRYDTVGSNDLTDNNTVLTGTGPYGDTCADFETSLSEYLSITDGAQSGLDLQDFTFAAWLNIEAAPGIYAIMGKATNDQYRLFYRATTKLQADIWNGGSESEVEDTTDLGTATWVHVVLTWDVSTPKGEMYVDGATIGATTTKTAATSISNESGAFALGAQAGATTYDGMMQDAIIWNIELSSAEVSSLYAAYSASGVGLVNIERSPLRGAHRGIMRP